MNKFIVTTTVNPPTQSTLQFCKIAEDKDWSFIIAGDLSTPHNLYKNLEKRYPSVTYLSPDDQCKRYPGLSNSLGWNTIQRRNISFVYSYNEGADIIATVDDDNIPYSNWGEDILINKKVSCDVYDPAPLNVFDPLSATNHDRLCHRGYPVELLKDRGSSCIKTEDRKFLVQADLWDGDPDIDAITRLIFSPNVEFEINSPFCSDSISPFNSQNTFLAREVISSYMMIPYIGRHDDIWGSYIMQHYHPKSVVYNRPTVRQERNDQDLIKNLEDEIFGYRHTLNLINNLSDWISFLPDKSKWFVEEYQKCFSGDYALKILDKL